MRRAVFVSVMSLVLTGIGASPARAAMLTVDTIDDVLAADGACSLREAMTAADADLPVDQCGAGQGADTIGFDPALDGQTIELGSDLPSITDPAGLTIDGGGTAVTIDAFEESPEPQFFTVFAVGDGAGLITNDITVQRGDVSIDGTLTVDSSRFEELDVRARGPLTVLDSTFVGALVWIVGAELTATDSSFSGSGIGVYGDVDATLENITMSGNMPEYSAVEVYGGSSSLTVLDSSFSDAYNAWNSGDAGIVGDGGAILNKGATLFVSDSTFDDNVAANNGGAIYNTGTATVIRSTFSDNEADPFEPSFDPETFCPTCGGGAIYNGGSLTVTDSAFVGNQASLGGGILNHNAASVTSSTFAQTGSGGDVFNFTGLDHVSAMTVDSTTFGSAPSNGDYANGGIVVDSGSSATLRNTIVAAGCDGVVTDGGHNLDSGTTCGFGATDGSLSETDPLLGPLADNGGPTPTHALLAGSPAIGAGHPGPPGSDAEGACPAVDQRGAPRRDCDIGAYELVSCAGAVVDVVGTPGPDVLGGSAGQDVIHGFDGSDTIAGLRGGDVLCGGKGVDVLRGGKGADVLFGGWGADRLRTVDGTPGNDVADGGPGRDTCWTDRRDQRISCR